MGLGPAAWPRVLGLAILMGWNPPAAAQGVGSLVETCALRGSAALLIPCQNSLLAAQAIRGGIAVAGSMGNELPGTSSTLGRRLGRTPRVSLGARFDVFAFDLPNIVSDGAVALPGETTVVAFGMKATAAVGVLDGFSVLPAVGGFLSFDVLASLGLLFLEEGDGFTENEGLISFGGRLGLLRESFTMPGVTVSLVQSLGERLSWGDVGVSGAEVDTDVSTTSLRATIGKDLFALALLVGGGLDWQRGDFTIRASDPGTSGGQVDMVVPSLSTRRTVFYAGASMTRLVFQTSFEAGWVSGFDDLPGYQGEYDPSSVTPFANLTFRLTI